MKKTRIFTSVLIILFTVSFTAFSQNTGKLVSKKSHFKFYSHTKLEDIEANNYTSVSTINTQNGEVVFSVPMQGFEFEKALMQKHFNNEMFLNTQKYPKAKLTGRITNLADIHFSKDGTYDAIVEGNLTIKGVTKAVREKGTITVKGNTIKVNSQFPLILSDYGITFSKGKPATNIAKQVTVSLKSEYASE